MQTVGVTLFHIVVTMGVLLVISLLIGKRHIGELSPLDFIVAITIGTVAGAGVVDPRIDLATVVISIVSIGIIQFFLSWLTIKSRKFQHKITFEPTVLIENGIIIKNNLEKIRLPLARLLGLLREKEIFDINELELAILETNGKLSILKKPEFQPLKPGQVNVTPAANKILTPIIIEGLIQADNLQRLGFSNSQINELRKQYHDEIDNVFVAFMDQYHQIYIIHGDAQEKGVFLNS